MRISLIAVGILGLAACGISEDKYPEKAAEALCKYSEECYAAEFESYYGSIKECTATFSTYLSTGDYYADCEYSASNAKKCINAFSKRDCGEDYSEEPACDDIYDCQ